MADSDVKELEGGDYSPFHPDFDEKFPIDKLLNQDNMEAVASGKIKPLGWVSIFRNSPLKNGEAEMIMGKLVTAAVRAGQWVDIPPVTQDESLSKVNLPGGGVVDFSGVKLEFTKATDMMVEQGYATIQEDNEGGQWFSPTGKLLEFMAERLKPYGVKEENST